MRLWLLTVEHPLFPDQSSCTITVFKSNPTLAEWSFKIFLLYCLHSISGMQVTYLSSTSGAAGGCGFVGLAGEVLWESLSSNIPWFPF